MAEVMRPTVTRVRRNTASMTSPWLTVRHDDAVLDRVAADDAAGRDLQAEDRIARRRELVHQLEGRRAAVEHARVPLLQDDHAAALDALVGAIDRGRHEVGEVHVRDEPAALVDLQHRLLAVLPLGNPDLARQHARCRRRRTAAARSARSAARQISPPFRGHGAGQVGLLLLGRAALVNRRQRRGGWRGCTSPPRHRPTTARRRPAPAPGSWGPSMKPPYSGSMHSAVIPASSNAASRAFFSSVQSWELRPPLATSRATGPRATARTDCTTICRS